MVIFELVNGEAEGGRRFDCKLAPGRSSLKIQMRAGLEATGNEPQRRGGTENCKDQMSSPSSVPQYLGGEPLVPQKPENDGTNPNRKMRKWLDGRCL